MDAQLEPRKRRIIEGADMKAAVLSINGHILGSIVRGSRQRRSEIRRYPQDDVATFRVQRVSGIVALIWPPGVLHRLTEFPCDSLRDLVFEALAGPVRERQVIRIGA